MIGALKRIFAGGLEKGGASEENLDDMRKIQLATCALFLEMAHIDGEFSPSERGHIINSMKKIYGLSEKAVPELMEAADEELKDSIDLWQFTNSINQSFSPEEKIHIIEAIWHLVFADGHLEKHEDYLIHRLANLLRLSHKQLIEAKVKVMGRRKP